MTGKRMPKGTPFNSETARAAAARSADVRRNSEKFKTESLLRRIKNYNVPGSALVKTENMDEAAFFGQLGVKADEITGLLHYCYPSLIKGYAKGELGPLMLLMRMFGADYAAQAAEIEAELSPKAENRSRIEVNFITDAEVTDAPALPAPEEE